MTDKFCPLIQGKTCDKLCGFYSEAVECCELIAISKQVLGLDQTEPKETFIAKMHKGSRITIYEPVRENLELEIGDLLRVTVHLEKKRDQLKRLPWETTEHDEEPEPEPKVTPEVEVELESDDPLTEGPNMQEPPGELEPDDEEEHAIEAPDEPQEKESIEEAIDLPSTAEVTPGPGTDEETVTVVFDEEPEPEVEEVVEYVVTEPLVPDYTEELEEETESPAIDKLEEETDIVPKVTGVCLIAGYDRACPEGLDYPLQDIEVCISSGCKQFMRTTPVIIDKAKPLTEEPLEEPEEEHEYVEPCPSDLSYPLQDIKLCRGWKCSYYKKEDKEGPETCTWPGWKKTGEDAEVDDEPLTETNDLIAQVVVKPEPEEASVEEPEEEQEYMDPCVKGLDRPLEDLNVCRKCKEYYKRRWGKKPALCTWPDWKKIGWEDDVEVEPVNDIVEEPTESEPESEENIVEPPLVILDPKPDEPIEESTETEYDNIILMQCSSGAHESKVLPHGKKELGGGWAMYICTECGKETPMLIRQAEPEDPF